MIPNTGEKGRYLDEARARCRRGAFPDFTQSEILDILNEIEWRGERIIGLNKEIKRREAQYNDRELRLHEEMAAVRRELDDARKATIRMLQIVSCSLSQEIPARDYMEALIYGTAPPNVVASYTAIRHIDESNPSDVVVSHATKRDNEEFRFVYPNKPVSAQEHNARVDPLYAKLDPTAVAGVPASYSEKSDPKRRPHQPQATPPPAVPDPACSRCHGAGAIQCSCQQVTEGIRGHLASQVIVDELKDQLVKTGWTKSTSQDDWTNEALSLLDPDAFESALHHGLVRPELLPNRIATPQLCAAVLHANHLAAKLRECIQCVRSNFGDYYDDDLIVYLNSFEKEVFGDIAYGDMGEPEAPPAPHCKTCGDTYLIRSPSAPDPGECCPDCIPF